MSGYSEKLKNRNWQKRRLEIMSRDGFCCRHCAVDNESMLVVHHLYYDDGKLPWQYPDSALITLCENCHNREHGLDELAARVLIRWFRRAGFSNKAMMYIADGLCEVKSLPASEIFVAGALCNMFINSETFAATYENFKDQDTVENK